MAERAGSSQQGDKQPQHLIIFDHVVPAFGSK